MIVGLTGGIATGKSTMSTLLREQGLAVIDADQIAREVVAPGTDGLAEIVSAFGTSYLLVDGGLDRERLGSAVFADEGMRLKLNAIVHPRVRAQMWRQAREIVRDDASRIAILDVPLLMEGGTHTVVDVTVLVFAPEDVQLTRLMARSGLPDAHARARIAAQWPIERKRELAQIVVDNSGSMTETPRLALALTSLLTDLARRGARPGGLFDTSVIEKKVIQ